MSDSLIVQFVGYEVRPLAREYTFTVREDKTEPREFTLTIASAAFDCRRARFQDARKLAHKVPWVFHVFNDFQGESKINRIVR